MMAPPGWYPDPYDPRQSVRWWSSEQWTYHRAPRPDTESPWRPCPPRRLAPPVIGMFLGIAVAFWFFVALFVVLGRDATTDSFAVRFENDLDRPVILALCQSDHSAKCKHPFYRARIAAGDADEENIAPDVRTEWAVETTSGRLLGCVNLYWNHYPGRVPHLRLSRAAPWSNPCPHSN